LPLTLECLQMVLSDSGLATDRACIGKTIF
jgi:hypothetical protein